MKMSYWRFKMFCENCGNSHDGSYASGRFCDEKCARAFSSKEKRQEINRKVSEKLKGRTFRRVVSEPYRKRMLETLAIGRENKIANFNARVDALYHKDWNQLVSKHSKKIWKHFIVEEQNGKCLKCGTDSEDWMGQKLVLELDHIDGNKRNDERKNLRMLCPNCHSQTETYCKGFKNKRV
jgi:hypothetical protein